MARSINAKRFSRVMRDLAKVPAQAAAASARDINREIQRGFDRGVDPYGNPWKPLARSTLLKGRRPPPLTDTRAGRNSVVVSPLPGSGIRIVVGKKYMIYNLFGAAPHLPQRAFIPFTEIPRAWGEIVLAHTEDMIKKAVARG